MDLLISSGYFLVMHSEEIRKKIGQFFMIGFEGMSPSEETRRLLKEKNLNGVILFRSNCPTLKKTYELIQNLKLWAGDSSLCVAIDHEGGRVNRLPKPFTHFPAMAHLGKLCEKIPSSHLAYEVGLAMGRELAAVGIHLNFAPVLDVHTNPFNPVIGDRAFSTDPEVVAVVGCQLIEGMQSVGVAGCGKHFPGHGDTNEDSHEVLPRLPHNMKRLESIELVPFKAAIRQKVATIMTAHVVFDGVDKNTPATFSVKILRDLLRDSLQFEGVIVSDDLAMGAVSKNQTLGESCVMAFAAGCDLLLVGKNPQEQRDALEYFYRAVEEKRIPESKIEESFHRISELKKRFCPPTLGLPTLGPPTLGQPPSLDFIGSKEHKELLNKIK